MSKGLKIAVAVRDIEKNFTTLATPVHCALLIYRNERVIILDQLLDIEEGNIKNNPVMFVGSILNPRFLNLDTGVFEVTAAPDVKKLAYNRLELVDYWATEGATIMNLSAYLRAYKATLDQTISQLESLYLNLEGTK